MLPPPVLWAGRSLECVGVSQTWGWVWSEPRTLRPAHVQATRLAVLFGVPGFICKMKRLEGISLPSTLRFHDSVLLIRFGLKFLYCVSLLKFLLMVYNTRDLGLGVGEREILQVKLFTVLLRRHINYYYPMYVVSGWVGTQIKQRRAPN